MSEDRAARAWLDSRTDEQIEYLLEVRPDLRLGAPLSDLTDLARRLEHPMSVSSIVTNLPCPAVELLEVIAALDAGASLARITALLDTTGRDPQEQSQLVRHWLSLLEDVGLAWEVAGLHVVNAGVHHMLVNPLLMGPPATVLAQDLTVDLLKRLYAGLGVPPPPRRAELLEGIGELYADQARIRQALARAPEEVMETLASHAIAVSHASMRGADFRDEEDEFLWTPSRQEEHRKVVRMRQWAVEHGLAFTEGYSHSYAYAPVNFPAEVLLALAPATYRAPFHPIVPPIPSSEVSPVKTERDSAAALTSTVAAMTAVLESMLRTPVQRLKTGGVGTRELNRLAKTVGVDTAEVRLALELGALCQFFDWESALRPSGLFEQWRAQPAPERAADLIGAWWLLRLPPTLDRDEDGKARPALTSIDAPSSPPALQLAAVLRTLDAAATGLEPVIAQLAWLRPLDPISAEELTHSWDEAARLGVIRDGALTQLGHALLSGERARVVAQLQELLPAESKDVLFGSDLTIVVPGSASAAVVDLLDALAVRESHGVGATWRVTEVSVRDALDNGHTVAALLSALREVAGKALPQPLEYLLADVDRRHGLLGVRPARCVVVSQDEGLLAEVAATKGLRHLGLAAVAPTVLVGESDPATTLAALRKAGYLPLEQDTDGTRTVALRPRGPIGRDSGADPDLEARLAEAVNLDAKGADLDADDLDALSDEDFNALMARELTSGGRLAAPKVAQAQESSAQAGSAQESSAQLVGRLRSGKGPAMDLDPELLALVVLWATGLRQDEQRHLAAALANDGGVVIRYRNESGNESTRHVSDLSLSGGYLMGYCHLRQDSRYFRLDRITMVMPLA